MGKVDLKAFQNDIEAVYETHKDLLELLIVKPVVEELEAARKVIEVARMYVSSARKSFFPNCPMYGLEDRLAEYDAILLDKSAQDVGGT